MTDLRHLPNDADLTRRWRQRRARERALGARPGVIVAGVDEVGRGALAGPVAAGAVVLGRSRILGIDDSKRMTPERRAACAALIWRYSAAAAVGFASVSEIECRGIVLATQLAMWRALLQLDPQPDLVLVDGFALPLWHGPQAHLARGDALTNCIGAASIIAKVARDSLLVRLDRDFPEYGWADNKGYGTATHYAALADHGPTPWHRLSFLKKMYARG